MYETRNVDRLEPLLLFAVLFLPGYLAQGAPPSGALFDSIGFHVAYLVQALPQLLLLLYLIRLRYGTEAMAEFGVVRPTLQALPWALLGLAAIFLALAPVVAAESVIRKELPPLLRTRVSWHLGAPSMLPAVLFTCVLTGYLEELFFRSYLLTVLPRSGLPLAPAVAASTLLFASGHLYEGMFAFVGTALVGLLLSGLFLWRRNLHVNALAHALYNFVTLLLTLVAPGVLMNVGLRLGR